MSEMVSIIIPVYQSEQTIERCVTSILKNTYKKIQIILCEDCSMDHSWEKCLQLQECYPNVTAIRNEGNRGVSFTRNQGLKRAEGTYLMFVDSDDWVEEEFVERMVDAYEEAVGGIPVCGYVNHDEIQKNETEIFAWRGKKAVEEQRIEKVIEKLYQQRLLKMIWNKLFLMEVIRENQIFFEEERQLGEDFQFLLRYLEVLPEKKILLIRKAFYHYSRENSQSLAKNIENIRKEDTATDLKKMYKFAGRSETEIEKLLKEEEQKKRNYAAYVVMHEKKMSIKEKEKKILELSPIYGKQLFQEQKKLYLKEKISQWLHRNTS